VNDPALLTMSEASDILGISRSTGYRLARRGAFPVPVLRVGRLQRVARHQLNQYLGGGVAGAPGEPTPAADPPPAVTAADLFDAFVDLVADRVVAKLDERAAQG